MRLCKHPIDSWCNECVAAHVSVAVEAEREACAEVAEYWMEPNIAVRIRTRGKEGGK